MSEYEIYEAVTSMRNRIVRMDREGDYWTEEEKEQLVKLFREGEGITAIAIRLQRTEPAIMQQIEKMDLYRRKEAPVRRKSDPKPPACLCDNCKLDPASCPPPWSLSAACGGRMMFEDYPDILTVEEACEALRVGYNAMYELLNNGKLKAYKNGRTWRIPRTALTQYILENAKIKPI